MSTNITIDLEKLASLQLTPTEYSFLMCEYKKYKYPGLSNDIYTRLSTSLQTRGWCKLTEEGIILKQKFLDTLVNDSSPLLVDSWIDDWRELFPKEIRSAGRPIRGDKKACLKKMITFCKEYPEYDKKQIFEASRIYIFDKKRENYQYMVCADYFIYKETRKGERTSLLASLLEAIDGRQTDLQIIENGDDPFSKEI